MLSTPYLAVAAALICVLSFGAGYRFATSQAENKLIAAAAEAYDKGTAAQQAYDAGNFKKAQADFLKRHAANQARDDALHGVEEAVHPGDPAVASLVPHVDACTVSATAMKKLNEVAQ